MENYNLQGRRVLVTGADGFMGSHLTESLLNQGALVSIYVRGNSTSGTTQYVLKNLEHVKGRIQHILTGDIASSDAISLIKKNNPEFIFHLAADAYVPNSFDHPVEVKQTNLDGTLNVLHAAMDIGVQQLVCTSSSEIYGSHQQAIAESHELFPSSPYAASKVAADRYCYAYWNTYKVPVAIIRPFNTYGPRHSYDVIPKFIKLALQNKPITVYGDGKQTRDFTYVDDMVRAFLMMGSDPRAIGQAVNFGTGIDTTIEMVARMVVELSGSQSQIVYQDARTSEVSKLLCDSSKAKSLFGWQAQVSLREGILRNIEHERTN